MEQWPLSLPQSPLGPRHGYRRDPVQNFELQKFRKGPPNSRALMTDAGENMDAPFALTKAQYETFKLFYLVTLAGGVKKFTLPDAENPGNSLRVTFREMYSRPRFTASDIIVTLPLFIWP